MNSGETQHPDWEETWARLRRLVRHGFPNPERQGCFQDEELRQVALDLKSVPMDDPRIAHAATCSPCFDRIECFREEAAREK